MKKNTSTVLRLLDTAVEWTRFQQLRNEQPQITSGRVPLPAEEPSDPADALLGAGVRPEGVLVVGLPADRVLLRIMSLPSTADEELAGMVELQVDKISPFSTEQMASAYEVLERRDNDSLVLIAALPFKIITELSEWTAGLGKTVQRLDVDLLGRWQTLCGTGHEDAEGSGGRRILLLLEDGRCDLIATDGRQPLMFRALKTETGNADAPEEALEELGYTLRSLEADWGAASRTHIDVWAIRDQHGNLNNCLRELPEISYSLHDSESLPPATAGLAQRASGTHRGLDLAPSNWRRRETQRRQRRVMALVAGATLTIWLAGAATLATTGMFRQRLLAQRAAQLEQLETRAGKVRALRDRISTLELYGDRSRSALEYLREISAKLPPGIELNSFEYRKGYYLSLRGTAQRESPIYEFLESLEASEMFAEVKPEGISAVRRGNILQTEFRVQLALPGGYGS